MQLAFGLPFLASSASQVAQNAVLPPSPASIAPAALERVVPARPPLAHNRASSHLPLDRASLRDAPFMQEMNLFQGESPYQESQQLEVATSRVSGSEATVSRPAVSRDDVSEPARQLLPKSGGNSVASMRHPKESQRTLPRSILPFPTKTEIRQDVKSLGAVAPRNSEEQWLQDRLAEIADANSDLFAGLSPDAIRLTYDPSYDRLASVDTEGLEITFGPKAFELTGDLEALTAIFCHELSHLLMGHRSFSNDPPVWLQAAPLVRVAKARQARRRSAVDVYGVKPRYDAMRQLESTLRAEIKGRSNTKMDSEMGALKSNGDNEYRAPEISLDAVKAYAAESQTDAANQYRGLLAEETAYQQQIARWMDAMKAESHAIDVVLGEEGASANWREEQADTLGLRLFLQWGGRAEDFFNALVRTLSRKDPGLVEYVGKLFSAPDLTKVPSPVRGNERHPSPRWRVYNLLVRELHLRYPKDYLKLLSQPLAPALRGWLA
jgi:hypothetical protein